MVKKVGIEREWGEMKSTITLTSDQLTQLKNNEQVGLCVPLGEQPPDGYVQSLIPTIMTGAWLASFHLDNAIEQKPITIPLQFPGGQVLGVRESWRIIGSSHRSDGSFWIIEYKDGSQLECLKDTFPIVTKTCYRVSGTLPEPCLLMLSELM